MQGRDAFYSNYGLNIGQLAKTLEVRRVHAFTPHNPTLYSHSLLTKPRRTGNINGENAIFPVFTTEEKQKFLLILCGFYALFNSN